MGDKLGQARRIRKQQAAHARETLDGKRSAGKTKASVLTHREADRSVLCSAKVATTNMLQWPKSVSKSSLTIGIIIFFTVLNV